MRFLRFKLPLAIVAIVAVSSIAFMAVSLAPTDARTAAKMNIAKKMDTAKTDVQRSHEYLVAISVATPVTSADVIGQEETTLTALAATTKTKMGTELARMHGTTCAAATQQVHLDTAAILTSRTGQETATAVRTDKTIFAAAAHVDLWNSTATSATICPRKAQEVAMSDKTIVAAATHGALGQATDAAIALN